MIDLHTHSTASDGSLSPADLLAEAAKRGISALALTDHDTMDGQKQAAKAALEHNVRFIPGIELEIVRLPQSPLNWEGDFHLLGLGIERPTQEFVAAIEELGQRRLERNFEIIDKINKAGINLSYDEIVTFAGKAQVQDRLPGGKESPKPFIGRPHFAAFLVKRKAVRNLEQAFSRYLAKGKPFFIPKPGMEFEHAARLIHESGGIAVLAHPMSLYISWGRLPELLVNLKERGLNGIEAWHPSTKQGSCQRLEELGRKLKLIITAGSDFHGKERADRKLGITAGGRKIDDKYLEGLNR